MKLVFKGQGQLVVFLIDRKKKELKISSSKTSYKLIEQPWKMLFDPGKERTQEAQTDKMDDDQFKSQLIQTMLQTGYTYIENG